VGTASSSDHRRRVGRLRQCSAMTPELPSHHVTDARE
jgi:hypothetical protein